MKKIKSSVIKKESKSSTSEKNGINLIQEKDKKILSIGISTAGSAEIEMARKNPNSHIIATTIDTKGIEFTKKIIKKEGLEDRIELKIEDISKKLPYADNYFDFIYARLVLHYLNNMQLEKALSEIYRVMKEYEEYLYRDYEQIDINPKPNKIIEVCVSKM